MPTILVVDDDKLFRWAVKDHLEAAGFQVLEAQSVEAARFLLPSRQLDAAVLDYHLPDGTAIDLVGDLRARRPDCLLAVVTAHPTDLCEAEALASGANYYLSKMGLLEKALDPVLEKLRPRNESP